jgi:hypothetical protein
MTPRLDVSRAYITLPAPHWFLYRLMFYTRNAGKPMHLFHSDWFKSILMSYESRVSCNMVKRSGAISSIEGQSCEPPPGENVRKSLTVSNAPSLRHLLHGVFFRRCLSFGPLNSDPLVRKEKSDTRTRSPSRKCRKHSGSPA